MKKKDLDAMVAGMVLEHEVLGDATVTYIDGDVDVRPDSELGHWSPHSEKRAVYLKKCKCDFSEDGDEKIFGHATQCLAPVPFYSLYIKDAWEIVKWMMDRGVCRISNGDGDSFDVDFFSSGVELFEGLEYHTASITVYPDRREGFEESFATAICYAAMTVIDPSTADTWKRWIRRGDDEVSGM